jgi:hypothetical protein
MLNSKLSRIAPRRVASLHPNTLLPQPPAITGGRQHAKPCVADRVGGSHLLAPSHGRYLLRERGGRPWMVDMRGGACFS